MKTTLCFFDDFWIDHRNNVKRVWRSPQQAGFYEDPAFPLVTYPSMEWCSEAGLFRIWYDAVPNLKANGIRYLCMAESQDGCHWTPAMVVNGDPVNQQYSHCVYSGGGGVSGSGVFRDPFESNPELRYKFSGLLHADQAGKHSRYHHPLSLAASPDGINWTALEQTAYPYLSDTYNRLYFNPVTQTYNLIMRGGFVDRRICMLESADLTKFTDPRLLLHPDPQDEDSCFGTQYYGMGVRWNQGMFMGLLMRFHTSLTDGDLGKMNGYMDTELVYSYDGNCWMHTTRNPLVEKPCSPDFGFNQLYLLDMTDTPDGKETLLVGVAARNPHLRAEEYDFWQKDSQTKLTRLQIYKLRKNGFCALECCGMGGKLITKPFLLEADDLTLNLAASSGKAAFSILDYDGKPYPGFSSEDSLLGNADGTDIIPKWKDHDLQELVGKRIRFCLEYASAAFYSLSGSIRPFIAGPQVSVSNPTHMNVLTHHDQQYHPFSYAAQTAANKA